MAQQQKLLGGRYLLKDKVGAGGMASVYRATDQVLDRTVAIKIMLPQYASDATFAARFKQEAQAAAGLQSPYIVGVYDWGKDGDTYYIVMEYLRGTDLKSGIRSHGALDPKKVAQIASQICGALSVAHKHEIIHRDIKPQNIMVLPDGSIKVMDFGIARAKNSHLTQDNNVLGTAHYVSPEQTRGQELGPTSDIYSLGVVMYECATGKVPFDGNDAISVALKQVNELPVPPSQINPNVDGDLERIILRCMEKDPQNRFQSADELRQVLNSYLAGRTVDVPEPTRVISAAGAATTRVMSESTQAMARPVGGAAAVTPTGRATTGKFDTSAYAAEAQKSSKGKIIAAIVAVIAVVAIAVYAASTLFAPAEMLVVPNVLGETQQAAEQAIEAAGFKVGSVDEGWSDEYAKGEVMEQHPTADGSSTAPEGSEINIVISQGQQEEEVAQKEVPDLSKAANEDEARKMLREVGLEPGEVKQEPSDDVDEGKIMNQSPDAGTMVDEGSTVDFTVSSGPDSKRVPDLTGMTRSQADKALSDLGFGVTFDERHSSTVAEGLVVSWNPSGNQPKGAEITVIISMGPEETEKEPEEPSTGDDPSTDDPDTGDEPSEPSSGGISASDIPDLTGLDKASAEGALNEAGLPYKTRYADGQRYGVDPDIAISWEPSEDGTYVDLVVAWSR